VSKDSLTLSFGKVTEKIEGKKPKPWTHCVLSHGVEQWENDPETEFLFAINLTEVLNERDYKLFEAFTVLVEPGSAENGEFWCNFERLFAKAYDAGLQQGREQG
jgi:hypothetical protein